MDQRVADGYRRFARVEAHGASPIYEDWAQGIAADPELVELIAKLPRNKQQPNLIFAAARWLGCPVASYAALRPWLLAHWSDVAPVVMSRATQTNEAGRCAVLLPLLRQIPGPLALIEVGASAGLCLYPDLYSYCYTTASETVELDPAGGPSTVQLPCRIDNAPVPDRLPEVVYRGGVDLNPIDVRNTADLDWLETLIWPEHQARRDRLHAAAAIAAANPAELMRGDLIDSLPGLVDAAPPEATVVVFHTAVLNYLDPPRRQQFVDLVTSMPAVTWISNEGATVLPSIAQQVDIPADGRMIVALNGRAAALAGPHGQTYERIATPRT